MILRGRVRLAEQSGSLVDQNGKGLGVKLRERPAFSTGTTGWSSWIERLPIIARRRGDRRRVRQNRATHVPVAAARTTANFH
jgi:hypothetical protein